MDEALTAVAEDGDIGSLAQEIDEAEDVLDVANKAPIIKLVNTILFQALKLRASDVHFQCYAERMQVRFRIDGILYDMDSIPRRVAGSDHQPRQGHGEDGHRRAPVAAGRTRDDQDRRRRGRRAHQLRAHDARRARS